MKKQATAAETALVAKTSFIAEARRTQIMHAAVLALNAFGYRQTSLARIAKQAGISTALISYHFKDKQDLLTSLLQNLVDEQNAYLQQKIQDIELPIVQLMAYIQGYLAYAAQHQAECKACREIVFNTQDDAQEGAILEEILQSAQGHGYFSQVNIEVMVLVLQGALKEYTLDQGNLQRVEAEVFGKELIGFMRKMAGEPRVP